MSAFTVFHPAEYCLTIGSASWAPTQSSFLGGQWLLPQTEDPHSGIPPFRKEGEKGWEEREKNYRLKAGNSLYTSKAYILSEQNHSFYLYAKSFEVGCT